MKILLITLLITTAASARQYIQCSDMNSWDRTVINLDGEESTLFMTTGLQDPDELRVLKELNFVAEDEFVTTYKTDGQIEEIVTIPNEFIGVATSYLEVEITLRNIQSNHEVTKSLGCFSSIY